MCFAPHSSVSYGCTVDYEYLERLSGKAYLSSDKLKPVILSSTCRGYKPKNNGLGGSFELAMKLAAIGFRFFSKAYKQVCRKWTCLFLRQSAR